MVYKTYEWNMNNMKVIIQLVIKLCLYFAIKVNLIAFRLSIIVILVAIDFVIDHIVIFIEVVIVFHLDCDFVKLFTALFTPHLIRLLFKE